MENFEVKIKDVKNRTYGIWNANMQAFQYIHSWSGTETDSIEKANQMCKQLNAFKYR